MALALATHVESVLCLDESAAEVAACHARGLSADFDNVGTRSASFDELLHQTRELVGEIDIFKLFAVLDHMTLSERLTVLETAASVLARGGVIVVGDTPNCLLWNDYHTTETPFFGLTT